MIDMKQVMDLNEYEKRKEVRVKSQLYFKAITKVMEEKNYLHAPGESDYRSFLGYLEIFFDFLTKDLISLGYTNMGYLIGDSHPDIKAKVESLGDDVKYYLILHENGQNLNRNTFSFKTPKRYGVYDWSLIAAVSIDQSANYQYHSISYENSSHVFNPSNEGRGNGSIYDKLKFKWSLPETKDLSMLAILLKKITIQ